jgi:hypothetical protein
MNQRGTLPCPVSLHPLTSGDLTASLMIASCMDVARFVRGVSTSLVVERRSCTAHRSTSGWLGFGKDFVRTRTIAPEAADDVVGVGDFSFTAIY